MKHTKDSLEKASCRWQAPPAWFVTAVKQKLERLQNIREESKPDEPNAAGAKPST